VKEGLRVRKRRGHEKGEESGRGKAHLCPPSFWAKTSLLETVLSVVYIDEGGLGSIRKLRHGHV